MTISGFTFARNVTKFYYPIKESIQSILPIVDEFIIALGDSDEDDKTAYEINSIGSEKIKIINRTWDEASYSKSKIFSVETNFALSQCKGDWCFYIQADEVMHEQYLDIVKKACEDQKDNKQVEGLLFQYKHFWGDYDHHIDFHGWYPREIRIVRNNIGITSFRDAQSFRTKDNKLLKVVAIPASIYHYGWVRPPQLMKQKRKEQDSMHWGKEKAASMHTKEALFDYGPLGNIPVFNGTHPDVLKEWINNFDWKDQLNYGKKFKVNRELFKHEKLKYRVITWIEKNILGGKQIGEFKNYKVIKEEK